jgi:hypothetical protein
MLGRIDPADASGTLFYRRAMCRAMCRTMGRVIAAPQIVSPSCNIDAM